MRWPAMQDLLAASPVGKRNTSAATGKAGGNVPRRTAVLAAEGDWLLAPTPPAARPSCGKQPRANIPGGAGQERSRERGTPAGDEGWEMSEKPEGVGTECSRALSSPTCH